MKKDTSPMLILKELPDFDYGYLILPANGQAFGLTITDYVNSLREQLNERAKKKGPYKYAVLFNSMKNHYVFKWCPERMTPAEYDRLMGFKK